MDSNAGNRPPEQCNGCKHLEFCENFRSKFELTVEEADKLFVEINLFGGIAGYHEDIIFTAMQILDNSAQNSKIVAVLALTIIAKLQEYLRALPNNSNIQQIDIDMMRAVINEVEKRRPSAWDNEKEDNSADPT